MLKVDRIDVFIKTSHILREVRLEVGDKEVVCLIGRNGAGKSTIMRSIMGFLTPNRGQIQFQDRDITGLPPYDVAKLGIAFSPEDSGIFPDLTTWENIEYPTWTRETSKTAEERIGLAYSVFPVLEKFKSRKGTQLSGGERKMLSIARALALDPFLLLLDEPFEGLSPAILPQLAESIQGITRMGPSILIAESNIYHVPEFTNRLYVIERGEIIFSGKPEEVYGKKELLKIIAGAA
ncbi:MAG: ATP-binding cassette domain-containing protein [Proteobacteria bacterium]|nr:ATP-binding cassette domain-containing protein [Pseudomonadota bacterium]